MRMFGWCIFKRQSTYEHEVFVFCVTHSCTFYSLFHALAVMTMFRAWSPSTHVARMLLVISRTCCTSAFSACSRQPRRWTPFVRYFTYSLHFCLLSHIVSCVRKVNQTRQIAVYSNALVVEIWRDVGNHEKPNSEKPLLWLLFVAFEQHHVGHVFSTVGVFCVPS